MNVSFKLKVQNPMFQIQSINFKVSNYNAYFVLIYGIRVLQKDCFAKQHSTAFNNN